MFHQTLKKECDERQARKSLENSTSSPVVFQNRPITFGLTSRFDQAAFLQKVTTSPADATGAKWKPFGAVDDGEPMMQEEPPSPEPVMPPFP